MTRTIPGSENYQCKTVVVQEYKKHPNADKLFIITVDHNNVITGVEPTIGQMYVYFPVLSKINSSFLSFVNAFDKPELNSDPTVKGFFTSKCRVKPIKLRGLPSEGYLHPIESVEAFITETTGHYANFIEGDEFNEVFGTVFCDKYVSPSNQRSQNGPGEGKKGKNKHFESRLVDGQFTLHGDTSNLRKNLHRISPDSIIEISYKKHGTSLVVGNVQVKKELKWYEKLAKSLGVKVKENDYDIIYSSRRVIKNDRNSKNKDHFYGTDIWGLAAKEIQSKLPKGYTAYCEILGFLPEGGYIQKGFDYGCKPGQFKVYVYKITNTNEDGFVVNLTANQIKQFCEKYDLLFADTLRYYGVAEDLYPDLDSNAPDWAALFLDRLEKEFTEKNCCMCINKVPEEGIVLVVENMFEYQAFKLKSFKFLEYEDKQLEADEVNVEDTQN